MSLLKPDPKSCMELECLVDNMEEEPERKNLLVLPSFEKEPSMIICLLDNILYLIILIVNGNVKCIRCK